MRQFAIGDVHGCEESLLALLAQLNLQQGDELYFLGDYIDRGPDSKGVLDTIFDLRKAGYKVECLLGNHEAMMLGALEGNRDDAYDWEKNGGKRALQSFDATNVFEVPRIYPDFMATMPLVLEVGNYILVHGGLNFSSNNPLYPTQQMIWIRDWYKKINYGWLGNRIIIHGHTPQSVEETMLQLEFLEQEQVLNIDCGCVFNGNPLNTLACFELNSRQLFFQKNVEYSGNLYPSF